MVHRTIAAVAAVAMSVAVAAPAWAGRNQADELLLTQPQVAQAQQAGRSSATSLAAQRHRLEVQKLLNQLEAGKNVDPADVERVLRQSLQQD
jgi:hypothetical protein